MPTFRLQPVTDADFRPGRPGYHAFTVSTRRPVEQVWHQLHADAPLHWCRGIADVGWTSTAPHGVGATRTVRLSSGVRVAERYFRWEEEPDERVNAFSVESSNVPLFRRFGERYRVATSGAQTRFTWEFVIEPRVPAPLQPLARRAVLRDLDRLRRDTAAHFGGVTR